MSSAARRPAVADAASPAPGAHSPCTERCDGRRCMRWKAWVASLGSEPGCDRAFPLPQTCSNLPGMTDSPLADSLDSEDPALPLAALAWLVTAGADEVVGDQPQDRYANTAQQITRCSRRHAFSAAAPRRRRHSHRQRPTAALDTRGRNAPVAGKSAGRGPAPCHGG